MMIAVSVAGIAIEPTFNQAAAGRGVSRPAVGFSAKAETESFLISGFHSSRARGI
jgi:hypothetical protein